MNESQIRVEGAAGRESGVWWSRRVHAVDCMLLLLAVGFATFGAMSMAHLAPSFHGGM